jgi:hypothetical protein
MIQSQESADVIRMHRKAAKLSRDKLAEMSGPGKTVIWDIENGKDTVHYMPECQFFLISSSKKILLDKNCSLFD